MGRGKTPSQFRLKILSLNVNGCNGPKKVCLIKGGLDQARLDMVLMKEIKIKGEDVVRVKRKFGKWTSESRLVM